MSNRTVLDTTEPYSEDTSSEDTYPLSFQVRTRLSLFITFLSCLNVLQVILKCCIFIYQELGACLLSGY